MRSRRRRAARSAGGLALPAGLGLGLDHQADHRGRPLLSAPPALEPDLGDVLWLPVALLPWRQTTVNSLSALWHLKLLFLTPGESNLH